MSGYLFLLHQLVIGTIVDDILPKHGRRERTVYLLGIHILQLPIQDEIIAFCPQTHGCLLAQQDKGKDIAVLFATAEEEVVGVDAVRDGAADDGHPVEYDGRIAGFLADEQLRGDVDEDGQGQEDGQSGEADFPR